MSDDIALDIPVAPYEQDLQPEDFRSLIYSHENRQFIRWWKAIVDPSFNRLSGAAFPQSNKTRWIYEEQNVARYMAIVSDTKNMKRYMPQGSFESGDLTLMCMPDEMPISDHDWVLPLGPTLSGYDARTSIAKEPLIRGQRSEVGVGTLTSSGTAVTGSNTYFSTFLRAGDIVQSAEVPLRVASVISDTSLTLESAPSPAWNGNEFSRCREWLTYYPAQGIEEIRDTTKTYYPNTDFILASDGRTILWNSATGSPTPGATLSVRYDYYPKYMVVAGQILSTHRVQGIAQPQVVTLRIIKPDTLQE